MKRISVLLALIVSLAMFAHSASAAVFLGLKKASETISFPVICLDSAGQIVTKADSIHIITYADNNTAASYTNRTTTWPFSDQSFDTTKIYGDTMLWFADQIQDIDGTGANFQLAINVRTWFKKLRTDNVAIVQVLYDSLDIIAGTLNDNAITAAKIATDAIGASELAADAIGASELAADAIGAAEVANAAIDAATFAASAIDATAVAADAIGASEIAADAIGASEIAASAIGASELAADAITSSELEGTAADEIADSTWSTSFSSAGTVGGSIGDSLNNESYVQNMSRVSMDATAADNFETMLDGTGGAVFSLRKLNINNTTTDDTAIVARGNGVAPGAVFIAGATGPYGIGGRGVGTSAAGIAGIGGTGASAAGIYAYGGGAGDGIQASGGTTGDGIQATGGSTSGNGITVTSTTATPAFNIAGSLTGAGLSIEGFPAMSVRGADGSGANGLVLVGDSTGNGLNVSSEQGDAGRFSAGTAGSYNGHGLRTVGDGTGHGIYSQGGASAGDGMNLEKGSGGQDLDADLGLKDSAYVGAADAINDSTITATALVDSIWNEDSTGHYTSPNMAFTAAQTSSLSAAVQGAIADSVWGKSFTGAGSTAGSIGDSLNNPSYVQFIADGQITAAKLATDAITAAKIAADAIGASEIAADAVGASEVADNAIDAGAIATDAVTATKIAADAFTSSELATSFMDEIVDGVWNEDTTGHYTSPHFGYLAVQTGSSTGLDSAATSRIIKRTVWGVGVGSGADSTTQAQRTVTASAVVDSNVVYRQVGRAIADSTIAATALVDSIWNEDSTAHFTSPNMAYVVTSMLDNTITAAKIAADAITSSEIAADAIGASEIAADALSSSELAATAAQEIADQVWDEDTASHNITNSFGYFNNGRNWATVGQMVDSVWDEDSTGHYTSPNMAFIAALTAGGGGGDLTSADSALIMRLIKRGWGIGVGSGSDSVTVAQRTTGAAASVTGNVGGNVTGSVASVTNPVTVGTMNANTITASSLANDAGDEIADQVWDEAQAGHVTDGTFGYNLDVPISTRSTYTALSAADSGLVSRLIGRKGWGIAQGAGADSLTAAQRVISSTGSVTITGADIAAIGKAAADSTWQKNFAGAGSVAGSIGDSLNNSSYVGGGSGCAGDGSYTVNITVVDTSGTDTVLANQVVTINNAAQNGTPYVAVTNNLGKAVFNLDAGTWIRQTDAAGYNAKTDTFTVSGVRNDSLKLYNSSGDLRPISWIPNAGNSAAMAGFYFTVVLRTRSGLPVKVSDTLIDASLGESIRYTDTDRDGKINFNLFQNPRYTTLAGDTITTAYEITGYRPNKTKFYGPEKVYVESGTSAVNFVNLTRVQVP